MSVSTSRFDLLKPPNRIKHFICPSRANLKICVYKYENIVYCQLFPNKFSVSNNHQDIDLNNFPSKYLDLKDVKTRLSFSHLTDHTTAVLICSHSPPKDCTTSPNLKKKLRRNVSMSRLLWVSAIPSLLQ